MANSKQKPNELDRIAQKQKDAWAWQPPLPIVEAAVIVWPPQPVAALKYIFSLAYLWSVLIPFGAVAVVAWVYLQPALARCVEFQAGWILEIYGRNLGLMFLAAGGLHLYFHTFKCQGADRRFDAQPLGRDQHKFFANSQILDNILWSCASGVTLWTAYEVLFMWAYANDMLPFYLDWREHPVWFVLMFVAIPFWSSLHFHFIHRLLHWVPLYKIAHSVHHRNESIGPWSGFSMHPIEHLIYLSSVLIHLVLASHPIHILFHMQWQAIGAALSHTGFEAITFRGKAIVGLTSFHHQLHHKFYNCNYGNPLVPTDKWFGTNYDGTPESMLGLLQRQRAKYATAKNTA